MTNSAAHDAGIPSPENLIRRDAVIRACRQFFWSRGFIETDTPVRIPAPAMELHLLAPQSGNCWLRTSPELHMKRLLAAGNSRIFQIGPCFRQGERGSRPNPEFTLLEWYRAQPGLHEIQADTEMLIRDVT